MFSTCTLTIWIGPVIAEVIAASMSLFNAARSWIARTASYWPKIVFTPDIMRGSMSRATAPSRSPYWL